MKAQHTLWRPHGRGRSWPPRQRPGRRAASRRRTRARARRAAARCPPDATRSCSACRTAEIDGRRRDAWPAPRRFVGHTSGATPLSRARARGAAVAALRAPPAPDLRGSRRTPPDLAGCRSCRGRLDAGRASTPPRLARAARHGPFEISDERPRRLPRRRLDGLELPGDARGGGRASGRRRRPRRRSEARAALAAARAPHGRELGARSARAEALTGPVARGDEVTVARPSAPPWREAAPELAAALRRDGGARPRARRAGGAGMRTCAHRRRAARRARPGAPRRPHDRAGAHDGHLPRGPPVADAPGARGERDLWWCPCS